MKTKLHLGCGHILKEGWLNHDIVQLPGVDVVHDLREFCVLVPKLRLGTRLQAKLCFGGTTPGVCGTRTRGNGVAQTGAFPNRVWERGRKTHDLEGKPGTALHLLRR